MPMSKSNDKLLKENRELRRQIEILRAQVKSENIGKSQIITPAEKVESQKETRKTADVVLTDDSEYVKKDLIKSVVFSSVIFAIILSIYFSGIVS